MRSVKGSYRGQVTAVAFSRSGRVMYAGCGPHIVATCVSSGDSTRVCVLNFGVVHGLRVAGPTTLLAFGQKRAVLVAVDSGTELPVSGAMVELAPFTAWLLDVLVLPGSCDDEGKTTACRVVWRAHAAQNAALLYYRCVIVVLLFCCFVRACAVVVVGGMARNVVTTVRCLLPVAGVAPSLPAPPAPVSSVQCADRTTLVSMALVATGSGKGPLLVASGTVMCKVCDLRSTADF